jgi:phosphoribosylformimino-5-aminoimidazole carboxamide ribotide isomerase
MDVIPVLDLMAGLVVHGVQGDRGRYRPIESVLTPSSAPLAVARALREETGAASFYIADLDAIQGTGDHRAVIRTLADDVGLDLWVDAAISDAPSALAIIEAGAGRAIVGSETLPSLGALREIRDTLPPGRLLFSVDIGANGVISRSPALGGATPSAALETVAAEGMSSAILLTLDQVGTGNGPAWSTLETARAAFPQIRMIAGGGVRTPDDLARLADMGIEGALVATSLHRGWITGAHVRDLRHGRGA